MDHYSTAWRIETSFMLTNGTFSKPHWLGFSWVACSYAICKNYICVQLPVKYIPTSTSTMFYFNQWDAMVAVYFLLEQFSSIRVRSTLYIMHVLPFISKFHAATCFLRARVNVHPNEVWHPESGDWERAVWLQAEVGQVEGYPTAFCGWPTGSLEYQKKSYNFWAGTTPSRNKWINTVSSMLAVYHCLCVVVSMPQSPRCRIFQVRLQLLKNLTASSRTFWPEWTCKDEKLCGSFWWWCHAVWPTHHMDWEW